MCGIIGYVGGRNALAVLVDGLERLEYRGYDSAGVVLYSEEGGGFLVEKCAGRVADLKARIEGGNGRLKGTIGIGHTRWATHGVPNSRNAHPHVGCGGRVAIVHNGIIENHRALRQALGERGHLFTSETDTEALVHRLEEAWNGDPLEALREALLGVRGSFALVAMFLDRPDRLVAARQGSPLIVGQGKGEQFVASDIPALLPYTRDLCALEDGRLAELSREGIRLFDAELRPVPMTKTHVSQSVEEAQKHGFPHFMLKEIHEQPAVLEREIAGRVDVGEGRVDLEGFFFDPGRTRRLGIVACGTAWHAALFAKYAIEELAGVPVDVWQASEFRVAPPPLGEDTLVLGISQSGETADTLQAIRLAAERGAATLGVTNNALSSLAREADATVVHRAGTEIGVAATKTYTAQLAASLLLAIRMGRDRGVLSPGRASHLLRELMALPGHVQGILGQASSIESCARRFLDGHDFMFIGRRYNVSTAYEGALKMKEISYLHAEGYAAGEMKHGPLALVDPHFAVVAVAPAGETRDRMASNIQEIRARHGRVIVIHTRGDREMRELGETSFEIPEVPEILTPFLCVPVLQLLAYYAGVGLGRDVDKPRNLAKSVTVE